MVCVKHRAPSRSWPAKSMSSHLSVYNWRVNVTVWLLSWLTHVMPSRMPRCVLMLQMRPSANLGLRWITDSVRKMTKLKISGKIWYLNSIIDNYHQLMAIWVHNSLTGMAWQGHMQKLKELYSYFHTISWFLYSGIILWLLLKWKSAKENIWPSQNFNLYWTLNLNLLIMFYYLNWFYYWWYFKYGICNHMVVMPKIELQLRLYFQKRLIDDWAH